MSLKVARDLRIIARRARSVQSPRIISRSALKYINLSSIILGVIATDGTITPARDK
jgi:hypothetical protein